MNYSATIRQFAQFIDKSKMAWLKNHIFTEVAELKAEYALSAEPVPFEERKNQQFKQISAGKVWSNDSYQCAWLHITGKVPQHLSGKHLVSIVDLDGEGCVWGEDGQPVCGLTNVSFFVKLNGTAKREIEISKSSLGGEVLDYWIDISNNVVPTATRKKARFLGAKIVAVNDELRDYYYDFLTLSMSKACCYTGKQCKEARKISSALSVSFKLAKTLQSENVRTAREIVQNQMQDGEGMKDFIVYATGHAHLDLGWLWPIRETKRKAVRTFINQLNNIEAFDGYIFGVSQPQQLEWMEKEYPQLFERIKKAIAAGRIEPQGGMWVECDTNVTGGESLIRQCIYGKRYWKEKFDKDVRMTWVPDCFGYNGNLPQIIKKCDMDFFQTIKLSWNEHNKFPKRSFIWEGIDGSKVLAHMPPEDTYNGAGDVSRTVGAYNSYPEKDKTNTFSILFGDGDGGGGPSTTHIEMIKRQKELKCFNFPKVVMAPAIDMFRELQKSEKNLDTVKGELYLEKHQGTYTTQSNNKNLNRRIEYKLHNVEFLSTAAAKYGCPYPKEALDRIWKEVLLYQFHDIIPGSSINRIYKESVARYHIMLDELQLLEDAALGYFKSGSSLSAVNTNGFDVDKIVSYKGKNYRAKVKAYAAAALEEYVPNKVSAGKDFIENDKLKVVFGGNGNIVSLFDKEQNKEYAGEFINKLNVFYDKPLHYNAWDINWKYHNAQPKEFALVKQNIALTDGEAVATMEYAYGDSKLVQKIKLADGSPYVDIESEVDWHEKHKMLRAEFRPTVFADEVVCDIQMGNIKRTTKDDKLIEKAQFEICAHKWVDVSRDGSGFAVLSKSKYGWRVKDGLISLNMLRSPKYPDPEADIGKHTIKYALYPHKGDFAASDVASLAYEFNNPIMIKESQIELKPFAESDNKHVVIETVKTAECGDGIVVRMYEDAGETAVAALTVGFDYASVCETNMQETPLSNEPQDISALTFSPYEIKTLLFKKQ